MSFNADGWEICNASKLFSRGVRAQIYHVSGEYEHPFSWEVTNLANVTIKGKCSSFTLALNAATEAANWLSR